MARAGVFDSGVGGLTVVKSLLEHQLFDEIIYFGDTARVPYGIKDKNTIIRYSLEAVEFFKNFDIDILITACNSVSAYAIDELKAVAPFEISGVIEPGVKALINETKNLDAKILILGTKATINSGKYKRLLNSKGYKNINSLATSLFVPVVEEGLLEGDVLQSVMKHYFKGIDKPDYIILGCTHFPLIKDEISKFFPNAVLIHSGEAVVSFLENKFDIPKSTSQTSLKLFASENPNKLKEVAKNWLYNS
jgi:glutamate racemase